MRLTKDADIRFYIEGVIAEHMRLAQAKLH
jgi:hypothetical protein